MIKGAVFSMKKKKLINECIVKWDTQLAKK